MKNYRLVLAAFFVLAFVASATVALRAQVITATQGSGTGILEKDTFRTLRYRPEGSDFVIENGKEFFNRPLYGGNTAFRVDAGDKPEFLLYLPGRGGNLKFGIKTAKGGKWLNDASKIVARYRPGSMIYEISDPLLGERVLKLSAIALYDREGLVVRAEITGPPSAEAATLFWAYGGVNGERGRRDGDIGTENVPIGQFFQFRPEFAVGNTVRFSSGDFFIDSKAGRIAGVASAGTRTSIADGSKWRDFDGLLASSGSDGARKTPIVVGLKPLDPGRTEYLALVRAGSATEVAALANETLLAPDRATASMPPAADQLPRIFDEAERRRAAIASQVSVETPDPFVNAAVAALNVGADAVWDEPQGAFMHGAIAWRTKLLGWRGPYLGDALGWHERMRRHLEYWARQQNTKPIPEGPVKPDPTSNLARNEPELHTNGDISNSHYDMNTVYIDAVFRHLLWTGDTDFARRIFPVIKRHLAWEQRLFRREYGPAKLPLYEAYVVIWASDDLQYHGSGVAHSSAYNFYHNKMAARVARMIGEDPAPYEREASLIRDAMRENLWLPRGGWYGEYRDLLGLGRIHDNAALWTFYHAIDSEVPAPAEAWQMTRFVDTQIPHLPIRGENVPREGLETVSTTSWMPYTWSTNNVVMAEVMHTTLGYWQATRADEAFRLYKAAILDSMFMGICPGNVGSMTFLDANRRESQRDFADPSGTMSRATVEGLFGVRPDLLAGTLRIEPGFPAKWDFARLRHPDLDLGFERRGVVDRYLIDSKFQRELVLSLRVPARRDGIAKATVNGERVSWKLAPDSVGRPFVEIDSKARNGGVVEIVWKGSEIEVPRAPVVIAEGDRLEVRLRKAVPTGVVDPQGALVRDGIAVGNASVAGTVGTGNFGHKTVFANVRQGAMSWLAPLAFEVRPKLEIIASETQTPDTIRFTVRNNTATPIDEECAATINGEARTLKLKAAAFGESAPVEIASTSLSPGTNVISLRLANGSNAAATLQNWKIAPSTPANYETVDLGSAFNDRVENIFKHEYLSPRSPYVSLAIPKQGIGSWAHFGETFDVDASGLHNANREDGGIFRLAGGVPARIGTDRDIAFTSQWDNFPRSISVPLTGTASKVYLLIAGSTNQMQSRFENGEVVVGYTDGTSERLPLVNPTNWWPIDQDYMIDDYAFRRHEPIPPRVDLKTGKVRILDLDAFKTKGRKVPGGAATMLDLPLDPRKELKSLTVRTLANEVVIGLMSATLVR